MALSILADNLHVKGKITAESMTIPDGTLDDDAVAADAAIAATKLEHQHAIRYDQADGSDVVAAIVPVHVVQGTTATIVAIEAVCIDAPSGGDEVISVDLKKCNEASPSPATVLTGTIDISVAESVADCEVVAGTIASASLVDGDTLVVDVAVSGSTGTQGQGLAVVVTLREDAT